MLELDKEAGVAYAVHLNNCKNGIRKKLKFNADYFFISVPFSAIIYHNKEKNNVCIKEIYANDPPVVDPYLWPFLVVDMENISWHAWHKSDKTEKFLPPVLFAKEVGEFIITATIPDGFVPRVPFRKQESLLEKHFPFRGSREIEWWPLFDGEITKTLKDVENGKFSAECVSFSFNKIAGKRTLVGYFFTYNDFFELESSAKLSKEFMKDLYQLRSSVTEMTERNERKLEAYVRTILYWYYLRGFRTIIWYALEKGYEINILNKNGVKIDNYYLEYITKPKNINRKTARAYLAVYSHATAFEQLQDFVGVTVIDEVEKKIVMKFNVWVIPTTKDIKYLAKNTLTIAIDILKKYGISNMTLSDYYHPIVTDSTTLDMWSYTGVDI